LFRALTIIIGTKQNLPSQSFRSLLHGRSHRIGLGKLMVEAQVVERASWLGCHSKAVSWIVMMRFRNMNCTRLTLRSTVLPFKPGEREKDCAITPLPAQQKQTKADKGRESRRPLSDRPQRRTSVWRRDIVFPSVNRYRTKELMFRQN
jgi:hypothetical protein